MTYNFYGWRDSSQIHAVNDTYTGIITPLNLYDALIHVWCEYTCTPRLRHEWTPDNPTLGQCAITSFLAPAVTRYTAAETQRIILLSFIHNQTKAGTDALYDVITFAKKESNGADGSLAKIITINQNIADSYLYLYKDKDITNTSDLYPEWWENIKAYVANFLQKEGE